MTSIGPGPERLTESAVELRVSAADRAEDGTGDGWVDPIWALWEALPQRWRGPMSLVKWSGPGCRREFGPRGQLARLRRLPALEVRSR